MNTNVSDWWAFAAQSPALAIALSVAGLGVLTVIVALLVKLVARLGRAATAGARTLRGRRSDMLLTMVVAGLATATSAQGMWMFFDHVLGIDNVVARGALFAFIELAILVSALRSRRHRLRIQERLTALEHQIKGLDPVADADRISEAKRHLHARPATDVDGIAVWVLAIITGILSALDADEFGGIMFRLAAPLIAAWLWERGMIGEIRTLADGAKTAKSWLDRLGEGVTKTLVKLGWIDPTDADVDELDAQRRITRLVRAAHDLHTLPDTATARKREKAASRLRAAFLDTQARKVLETSEQREAVRQRLALLFAAETATAPARLSDIDPWTGKATTPSPQWTALDATAEGRARAALAADTEPVGAHRTSERGNGRAHARTNGRPASAHSGRSNPRVSTQTAITERSPDNPVSAHQISEPVAAAVARGVDVDGVPSEAVAWIAQQWADGNTELTGGDIAGQFGRGPSTGRRWLNSVRAHRPDLHTHHETPVND